MNEKTMDELMDMSQKDILDYLKLYSRHLRKSAGQAADLEYLAKLRAACGLRPEHSVILIAREIADAGAYRRLVQRRSVIAEAVTAEPSPCSLVTAELVLEKLTSLDARLAIAQLKLLTQVLEDGKAALIKHTCSVDTASAEYLFTFNVQLQARSHP